MYYRNMLQSENSSSADNQQERSKEFLRGYVCGLVDGEGSFHIAFAIRKDLPLGMSVIPEFHVSQNFQSRNVLELVEKVLGCGYIKPNHRNSKDETFVYVVRDRADLITKVIPFFEFNHLLTSKKLDFKIFYSVVRIICSGRHRTSVGMAEIIKLAYKMNAGGKRRIRKKEELLALLKSSTTTCQTPNKVSEKI